MTDRRDALLKFFTMALSAAGSANQVLGAGTTGLWTDRLFTLEASTTTPASFGATTVYFEGRTPELNYLEAGSVLLNPGQEPHPPHQHPEEEFMLIGEGHGQILVNGRNTPVGPGTLMYSEGNHLHGIKNTGEMPMRFYFVKWRNS